MWLILWKKTVIYRKQIPLIAPWMGRKDSGMGEHASTLIWSLNTQTNWRQIILKLRGETKIINKEKPYLESGLNSYFMNNVTCKACSFEEIFHNSKIWQREDINSSIPILLRKHFITAQDKTRFNCFFSFSPSTYIGPIS